MTLFLGHQPDNDEPYRIKPSALRTHGVVVGMTGSGKTGLCLVLLEELVTAGVPIIALDPKGDLGNLGLAYVGLGEAQEALEYHQAALAIAGELGAQLLRDTPCVGRARATLDRKKSKSQGSGDTFASPPPAEPSPLGRPAAPTPALLAVVAEKAAAAAAELREGS